MTLGNTGRSKAASIRVMLVDDSAVIRGLIKRMLDPEADIEVVHSVQNGQRAVESQARDPVEVIVLDIEMPVMDGLTALPKLIEISPEVKVIMASTLTLENAEVSLRALKLGATDYVPKPTSSREMGGAGDFKRLLIDTIRAVTGRAASTVQAPAAVGAPKPVKSLYAKVIQLRDKPVMVRRPDIIAIGSSTGGPQALGVVVNSFRPEIKQPIMITQHMPPKFTTILAKHLAESSGRDCREGVDGETVVSGRVYLAPGGFHMTVNNEGAAKVIRLNENPPENFCRPAVDPMFRSIAAAYGGRVLALILTGMGSDGCKGAQNIVDAGGTVIAQDEPTSVVWGMPGAAATAGVCTAVLPLDKVSAYVNDTVLKGVA